ncbi:MAG TPA: metallopeptidase family protein [Ktedonobacterales bacterium]
MTGRAETIDGPAHGTDGDGPQESGDYYHTLGVSGRATHDEIKRAFHREAKRWHPDHFAVAEPSSYERAERRMRQITEAYHVLSDPALRAAYDGRLREDVGPTGPGGVSSAIVGAYPHGVAYDRSGGEHASANPNGAGQFFAALAVVIGMGLMAGIVRGSASGNLPLIITLFILLVVLGATAALFMTESSASRWAAQVMEGEPRGFHPQTRRRAAPTAPQAATNSEPEDEDAAFARLVAQALESVPAEFRPYMSNIAIEIEQEPSAETLRQAGVPEGYTLLGLYRGVPLDKRGIAEPGPDIITIFRGPIERRCGGDLDTIREQARATTLHELAHHFGMDHDEMPEWVK